MEVFPEMLMYGGITVTTLCTDLAFCQSDRYLVATQL